MLNIIAGRAVYDQLQAEKMARVSAGYRSTFGSSEDLCAVQSDQARRGFVGVHLVRSIYGFSVRYDSGLQNFGIVASSRTGQLDGSYEAARDFAEAWVAKDPARRYAWISDYDQKRINEAA